MAYILKEQTPRGN